MAFVNDDHVTTLFEGGHHRSIRRAAFARWAAAVSERPCLSKVLLFTVHIVVRRSRRPPLAGGWFYASYYADTFATLCMYCGADNYREALAQAAQADASSQVTAAKKSLRDATLDLDARRGELVVRRLACVC
jgi:hypothetical protein